MAGALRTRSGKCHYSDKLKNASSQCVAGTAKGKRYEKGTVEMSKNETEVIEIPQSEAQAFEDGVAEEEWESDWGAIFWCCFFLVIALCGMGVAAWQPWVI